ncbi:MAG: hypothetical protein H6741_00670 [Alphaproteobacteria bacterium]|nr:hypothetical protein [Alphaproteobacteria bacterium]
MLLLLLACTGGDPVEPTPEPTLEPVAEPTPPEPPPKPAAPPGPALLQVEGKGVVLIDATGLRRVEGSPDEVDALALAPDGAVWLSAKGALLRAASPGAPFEAVPASGGPGRLEDMAFAPDGALWAVSDEALGVFRDGAWAKKDLEPGRRFFENVAVRADGVVFVSDSEVVYEQGAEGWTAHDIREKVEGLHFLDELVVGPDGAVYAIWAGEQSGLLRYRDGAWVTAPDAARFDGDNQGLGFTADGQLLTTNYDAELVQGAGAEAQEISKREAGYEAYELTSFAADANGRLWIGTDKGLVLLDAERKATQWSPGTLPALDAPIQRILVLAGGPPPPAAVGAEGQVKGRLLIEGKPLADVDVALCSDASLMHRVHPCESAALSLESQTDAEGRFAFEGVPFGQLDFVYRDGEDERWSIVIGAGCCRGVRPGELLDIGDVDLKGDD